MQEIEAAKMSKKSRAVEYECAPLLLLAILEEDKDLFYKVTEVNIANKALQPYFFSAFLAGCLVIQRAHMTTVLK